MTIESWRKCSSCKKPIPLGGIYYVCSVSSCNGKRTGYVFCSVSCFEVHLPVARHKDAGAVEMTAPKSLEPSPEISTKRRIIRPQASSPSSSPASSSTSTEVLIVASRLKDYIDSRSGFNTSSSVMNALSDHVRAICEQGIDNARADGRKTVMDKDFLFLKK